MTLERYQKINSLVDALLDLPRGERGPFLDRARADDHDLRDEVESLLAEHESESDFLETPVLEKIVLEAAAHSRLTAFEGRVLRGYEILSRWERGPSARSGWRETEC